MQGWGSLLGVLLPASWQALLLLLQGMMVLLPRTTLDATTQNNFTYM
jgi:hypothetical protein